MLPLRTLPLLLFLAGCSFVPHSSDDAALPLDQRLDKILASRANTSAIFSARVLDAETGHILYQRDIDRPMTPASNMKLPVSATALDLFGPDHTFKTWLCLDGEDLWIIGSGDPAVGDPRLSTRAGTRPTAVFEKWASALRARGITRIKGNLHYYDRALDDQRTYAGWDKSFLIDWYAAPVAGLNFNNNCIDVTVSPTKNGELVTFEVMPPASGIRIINQMTTGQKHAPAIDRHAASDVFTLTGTISKRDSVESKPVTDPGGFFADAFRTHLKNGGIEIEGKTLAAERPLGGVLVPPADKVVAVHETSMRDLLGRINKNSQNLFAEAVCKLAGMKFENMDGLSQRGSWAAGERAIRDFLQRNKIDDSAFKLADGSGLSRENRVSVHLISDLLLAMHRHPQGKLFRESLSVAGRDGTIGKRLKDLEGKVQAKTGYIGGVRSLSGYVDTRSGKTLIFSIIFNQIPGDVKPFEALQDDACRVLYGWEGK